MPQIKCTVIECENCISLLVFPQVEKFPHCLPLRFEVRGGGWTLDIQNSWAINIK